MGIHLPPMPKSYIKPKELFEKYWRTYGGFNSIILSPYLHSSIALTVVAFPVWLFGEWWEYPLSILPNIVGFTIGGYAILVAFNDEKFRALLAGESNQSKSSPYMVINATFMHFIIAQCFAILLGVIGKAYKYISPVKIIEGSDRVFRFIDVALFPIGTIIAIFGTLAFFYALMLVVAATANIFRFAGWYDKMVETEKSKDQK